MSCKLWGKITSVSVNINFGAKCQFCAKRIEIWEKCWPFLEKSDFLCEGLYTLTKCQILI